MTKFVVDSIDKFKYSPERTGNTRVYIDDSISSISLVGDDADGNTRAALRRIEHLAPGVVHILPKAFKGCSSLTYADIPDTVVNIDSEAFANCTSLDEVTLFRDRTASENPSIERFGPYAFYNTGLIDITLDIKGTGTTYPDTEYTFANCKRLRSVKYVNRCPMYNYGFAGCTSLTSVTFPEHNIPNWQGSHTFENCTALRNISFPAWYLHGIDDYMFAGCTSLETVDMSRVTSNTVDGTPYVNYSFGIGTHAFDGCVLLTELTLPPIFATFEDDKFIQMSRTAFAGSYIRKVNCTGMSKSDIENNQKVREGFGIGIDCVFYDKDGNVAYVFNSASVAPGGGPPPGKNVEFEDYDMLYVDKNTRSGFTTRHDVWYMNAKEAFAEKSTTGVQICLMSTGGINCSTCKSMYSRLFSSDAKGEDTTKWMSNSGILFLYDDYKGNTHPDLVSTIKSLGFGYTMKHLPCFNLYQYIDGVPKTFYINSPDVSSSKTNAHTYNWFVQSISDGFDYMKTH